MVWTCATVRRMRRSLACRHTDFWLRGIDQHAGIRPLLRIEPPLGGPHRVQSRCVVLHGQKALLDLHGRRWRWRTRRRSPWRAAARRRPWAGCSRRLPVFRLERGWRRHRVLAIRWLGGESGIFERGIAAQLRRVLAARGERMTRWGRRRHTHAARAASPSMPPTRGIPTRANARCPQRASAPRVSTWPGASPGWRRRRSWSRSSVSRRRDHCGPG